MSELLEKAIALLRQLPDDRQDLLSRLVIQEIEEDKKWMASTANYAQPLERLIGEVLADSTQPHRDR